MSSNSTRYNKIETFLRIGEIIPVDAYDRHGILLMKEGQRIDSIATLARLMQPDVSFDQPKFNFEPDFNIENIEEEIQDFEKTIEEVKIVKEDAVKNVHDVFERFNAGAEPKIEEVEDTVKNLMKSLFANPVATLSMCQLKDADEYTFTHSVNVAILSMSLCLYKEMHDDIELIGVGALLHDIGKIDIPNEILNKPGSLTYEELEIVKRHPVIGVQRLHKQGETREKVIQCVRDHHEKLNGAGYPNRKNGIKLGYPAKITAVADVYDALTTTRPYRRTMENEEAIKLMIKWMGSSLDLDILNALVEIVGWYPVGSLVELDNGYIGKIVHQFKSNPLRPVIQLINRPDNTVILNYEFIDLSKEIDISIKRTISNGNLDFSLPEIKAA